MIQKERGKVYVLENGKSLILALSQDMEQNRPAEARNHLRMFHELFFTLSPDGEAIKMNLNRALYLADKTAYNYYADLAEAGYYRRLIATNTVQLAVIDSIHCNFETYPYQARTFARQIIRRSSNVTVRSLVTVCSLVEVVRSDNNPHGLLIENFNIEKNDVLSTQKR
jgi:conjugative transposon TraK protein